MRLIITSETIPTISYRGQPTLHADALGRKLFIWSGYQTQKYEPKDTQQARKNAQSMAKAAPQASNQQSQEAKNSQKAQAARLAKEARLAQRAQKAKVQREAKVALLREKEALRALAVQEAQRARDILTAQNLKKIDYYRSESKDNPNSIPMLFPNFIKLIHPSLEATKDEIEYKNLYIDFKDLHQLYKDKPINIKNDKPRILRALLSLLYLAQNEYESDYKVEEPSFQKMKLELAQQEHFDNFTKYFTQALIHEAL